MKTTATLTVEFKHKSQVSNDIITGICKIVNEISGGSFAYWSRYQDESAKQFLAGKALEFTYGWKKAQEFIITSVSIS